MTTEVGSAFVSIVPSAKGFGRRLNNQVGDAGTQTGKRAGGQFGGAFAGAGIAGMAKGGIFGAIAGLAAGAGLGAAISKAGEFDKTLRTVGAAGGLAAVEVEELRSLALKMGADTVFSAQGAADAMLELSKGGMSAAQIKAGALRDTLLLASAGGLELGSAAGYMVQGLTTFGLAADQGGQVASALAGAANASTASVESIGQALAQVGPGAVNAGLSIQETTAALAAFDNAGIKGSDAGTSLKTMLTRLVPSTDKARGAMADLGLDFTDAAGNILPIADVAGQLQNAFRGLSEEAKTTALNDIFGSDAARAASVLATNGAEGINKMIAATSDAGAAARLAEVGTSGYAGALEQFKGSVETAQIALGTKLLPIATKVLNFATKMVNGFGPVGAAIGRAFGSAVGVARRFFAAIAANPQVVRSFQRVMTVVRVFRDVIVNTWNRVRAAFAIGDGLGDKMSGVFSAIAAQAQKFGPYLGRTLLSLGRHFVSWIGPLIPPLLAKVGALLRIIGTAIVTYGPQLVTAFLGLANRFIGWIGPLIPPLLTKLGEFGAALIGWITGTATPWLGEKIRLLADTLVGWIGPKIPGVIFELGQLASSIFAWFTGTALPAMAANTGKLAGALVGWILPKIPFIIAELAQMIASLLAWVVTDGIPKLVIGLAKAGVALVTGLAQGFASAFPGFMQGILNSLPDWFKRVFGIGDATVNIPTPPPAANRPSPPPPRGLVARQPIDTLGAGVTSATVAAQYNGAITVQAQDPRQMEKALAQRRRLAALAS